MLKRASFLFLLACAFNPGCLCNGNGHVIPIPIVAKPGDDVVNCVCNLTFANDHCSGGTCLAHFSLPLCLPLSLQRDGGTNAPVDLGPPSLDAGEDPYSMEVDRYCQTVGTQAVYHLIKVFNGGWCDYKAPFAPNGGVGDSVQCFAYGLQDNNANATAFDDGTCRTECDVIECDFKTNCGGNVQDSDGTIHPDRCKCSQIAKYGCPGDPPGDLPTPVFCRPPQNAMLLQ